MTFTFMEKSIHDVLCFVKYIVMHWGEQLGRAALGGNESHGLQGLKSIISWGSGGTTEFVP